MQLCVGQYQQKQGFKRELRNELDPFTPSK